MSLNPDRYSNYGSTHTDTEVIIPINNSREITTMCDNVSTNIYTVNSCIKNLKSVSPLIGTAKDSQGLRDKVHVWQLSANEVVKATPINKLNILARSANKQQKLQITKLTNHFKEAVQEYSGIQQVVAGKLRSNLLRSSSQSQEQQELLDDQLQQQAQQQVDNIYFEQELLIEREHRIREIEGDILDVNQLMRELGALVHEQGTVIDSIENNVETTHENVQLGQQQLTTAATNQNKLRKKKAFLLLLLAIVLAVLIGIIIWSAS